MNKNEKFVITINRELGSGGRTIGRKLAEKLGVQFFDKALLMALEEKYHLTAEEIENLKGRKQSWWEDFKKITFSNDNYAPQLYQMKIGLSEKVSSYELFEEEEKILNHLAEQESCVVAGRTGFYMLRNHPNHMNILIQASMPFRIERVMRKQYMTREEARETIDKIDKMREYYVKQYTKTSRYDTRNYDLVITVDGKTEDEIVDIILKFIG
ncbi:MAG: cytidylate kinase-like family protein [Bacteroidaceae bacterium]|nr:cytidylate kinase-like family protein [Bacteroidaceae bacterium]MBR6892713.1 cytidylate kinase-like family protein [Bacteroidaceae bacterium]